MIERHYSDLEPVKAIVQHRGGETRRLREAGTFVDEAYVSKKVKKGKTAGRLNSAVLMPKKKELISGESVQYLGKNYRLTVTRGTNDHVALRSGRLEVCISERKNTKISSTRVRSLLVAWYQEKALRKISEKVERYSKRLSVQPQSVKVRDYKSRWGSCILPNTASFNWRIVMAPHKVIDYVVVHDLCHLKHHEHSEKFWSTVKRAIGANEIDHRDWLKRNSSRLCGL